MLLSWCLDCSPSAFLIPNNFVSIAQLKINLSRLSSPDPLAQKYRLGQITTCKCGSRSRFAVFVPMRKRAK